MFLYNPLIPDSYQNTSYLTTLGYPANVSRLIYPQFQETVFDDNVTYQTWTHEGQDNMHKSRVNGYDVFKYLFNTNRIYNTATFHVLRYYTIYPNKIPKDWPKQYTHIVAWKALAYDMQGSMMVPMLYLKNKIPSIHWVSLSPIMHAGEATLLIY